MAVPQTCCAMLLSVPSNLWAHGQFPCSVTRYSSLVGWPSHTPFIVHRHGCTSCLRRRISSPHCRFGSGALLFCWRLHLYEARVATQALPRLQEGRQIGLPLAANARQQGPVCRWLGYAPLRGARVPHVAHGRAACPPVTRLSACQLAAHCGRGRLAADGLCLRTRVVLWRLLRRLSSTPPAGG